MKNKKIINSITLGAMFAAIYGVFAALSIYLFEILSVIGLFIMPIFAAYYASIYSFKETLLFNIAVIIVCFLVGIADPMYCIIYAIPTLIVGDMYGLLSKLNIKFYTTMILQTITYSITNIFALIIAEKFYETSIIRFIISDEWTYNNLSLSILFVLSGAQAVVSSAFIFEQLAKVKIIKQKENIYPLYGYISIISLFILAIVSYFIDNNIYFLCITMSIVVIIGLVYELLQKPKRKIFTLLYILFVSTFSLILIYFALFKLIFLVFLLPFSVFSIVKIIYFIYNKHITNKGV